MANFLGARKHGSFKAVSTAPSINKTPVGSATPPLPYPVMHDLGNSVGVVKNVRFNGCPTYVLKGSTQPKCTGDAPGAAKGIKSNTVSGEVKPVQGSGTVRISGKPVIREMDPCTLNGGNCPGIYTTQPGAAASLSSSNPPVEAETEEESSWWSAASPWVHGALGVASFVPGLSVVTGAVDAGLYAAEGNYGEAALAAASMIPGGKVATTTVKVAGKASKLVRGARAVEEAGKVAQAGNRARQGAKAAKQARQAAKGRDGAKIKPRRRGKKRDKPCDVCPVNQGPGGKPVKSRKPIHYGTGEEILEQVDFEVEGERAFAWIRTYRSGSECEDWGLLGARWASPYTASLSLSIGGIVYHEASGRALRLPLLGVGEEHDHGVEGFLLRRDSESHFTLTWRDGSRDLFEQGPEGWLPHGYDGANAMLKPQPPERVSRCHLVRSEERDGRGVTVERFPEALPGEPLLRLRGDDGLRVEALRDETVLDPQHPDPQEPPRIGRVEQILPGGLRVCHVNYRYEAEPAGAKPAYATLPEGHEAFETLPRRANLVEQSNALGHSRRYAYRHHLLLQCGDYSGFSHRLGWVSLGLLRERWAGSRLDTPELASLRPITLYNSYQARASGSVAEDGSESLRLDYPDEDTSQVTEPDGGILVYTFDENWLATAVRRLPGDGARPQSLGRREWDEDANLTAEIDAEGNTTRYAYDKAGNLTAITDTLGYTTQIAYDAHNQPIAVTDSLGHTHHQAYDDRGHLIESVDPLNRTTRYGYDEQGRLIRITDANGRVKRLEYDPAGLLAAYTDCSGHTTHYAYDAGGRLIAATDPLGQLTQYRYDPLGRLLQVTYPDRASEHYAYDPEGNLTTHTDAKGQITRYRYNGQGLPVERTDAKGQTLSYRYDSALRLTELINGNGESYIFTYDAESRLAIETGFDGKTTAYEYDPAGRLVASESGGVRTEYHRDPLGQLQVKLTPESHSRYAYDPLGRLTAVATPRAEQRYAYDAAGQLIEERHRYSRDPGEPPQQYRPSAAFKLKHEYDPLGNRLRTWLPNGRSVDTLRYGSGHWHGSRWSGRPLADLERDNLHRETKREFGQGGERLSVSRDYDPQSRLTEMSLSQGQKKLRERHYRYDLEGNLSRIDDRQRGITRYGYDPLGQLLSAVQPDLKETFAFDPAGNLLEREKKERPEPSKKANQGGYEEPDTQPLPEPRRVRHNRLEHYNGIDYEYDIQGNTVLKRLNPLPELATEAANETSTLDLSYDQENRLVRVRKQWSGASVTASYVYDAFGRRIAKTVREARWDDPRERLEAEKSAAPETTWFLWDGDNLIQEIREEKTVTYLYEPESFVPLARIESDEGQRDYLPETIHMPPVYDWEMLENPLKCEAHIRLWERYQVWEREKAHQTLWKQRREQAKENAAGDRIHYYHCDHLGTPLELYDENGKAVWSARYRAWGRIHRYETKEIEQPLRFQGQYEDEETGLYYNRYRYYDPDVGRYITQDPIGLEGGQNLYQYALGPTGWIDPLGLARKKRDLPALDSTGKVHGELPKPEDLKNYCPDELTQLKDELKKSVQQRIKKNIELGSDKSHGQRQAAEQQLIKSIEKYLGS